MKKTLFCLFAMILFSALIADLVLAWFPNTHTYIIDKIKESTEIQDFIFCFDSSINEQAIRAGNILPDITAIDYANPNKNYQAMHNWNFQQRILDMAESEEERCLAYGVAFHLIADNVSHNQFIPPIMEETNIPELLIHPLAEEKYDEWLVCLNKNLVDETKKSLDIFYGPKQDRYIKNVENALGKTANLNVKRKMMELSLILKTLNGIVTTDSFAMSLLGRGCKNQDFGRAVYMGKSVNMILEKFS